VTAEQLAEWMEEVLGVSVLPWQAAWIIEKARAVK
jgi:hypothetical protein